MKNQVQRANGGQLPVIKIQCAHKKKCCKKYKKDKPCKSCPFFK